MLIVFESLMNVLLLLEFLIFFFFLFISDSPVCARHFCGEVRPHNRRLLQKGRLRKVKQISTTFCASVCCPQIQMQNSNIGSDMPVLAWQCCIELQARCIWAWLGATHGSATHRNEAASRWTGKELPATSATSTSLYLLLRMVSSRLRWYSQKRLVSLIHALFAQKPRPPLFTLSLGWILQLFLSFCLWLPCGPQECLRNVFLQTATDKCWIQAFKIKSPPPS